MMEAVPDVPHPRVDRGAAAAAIFSVAAWLTHLVVVIAGPEPRVMAWLYDDCFYYVITAWHLSLQGISSFDGVTRTSGYHPLWMWICAGLVKLHHGLDLTLVRLCMGASALISVSLVMAALVWSLRRGKNAWLWTMALACSSYSAWNNGLTIMEWPLVVLSWTALHLQLLRVADHRRASAQGMLLALLTGVLLTLSRTDSGIITAAYVVGGLVLFLRSRHAAALQQSVAALLGAVAGLFVNAVYDRVMTGTWLQQSAIIKHLFAQVTVPFNPVPAIWQFLRVLLFLPRLELSADTTARMDRLAVVPVVVVIVTSMVFAVLRFRGLRDRWEQTSAQTRLTVTASVVGIAGYVLLDSFNSGAMYGWYTAPVTGFIVCLTSLAFRRMRSRTVAVVVVAVLMLNAWGFLYGDGNASGQYGEVLIGKYLHQRFGSAIMSGGDVGKPSFYNGGVMLNTDGLMNNEIVPYLQAGRIHCYLLERHVAYATGLGSISYTLEQRVRERRGDPQLPWQAVISHESDTFEGKHVDYFVIHPDAIRATGECDKPLPLSGFAHSGTSGSK